MKKEIHTKEYGYVVAVEYRKALKVGGSMVLPLTKYLPESDLIRIVVKEMSASKTEIVLERVNE